MKKIIFFSGIVVLLATPVLAGINMPDVNVTGEIRAKGVKTNNTGDFKDTTGTFTSADDDSIGNTRVRVNMNSNLSKGITAYLNLQYGDEMWGDAGMNGPNITGIELATGVRHAYLKIDDITGEILPIDINLALGRQGIGVLNRELVLYTDSINAKVAKATYNDLTVTGICALQTADVTRNNGDTNRKIQGITASYPLPIGEANLGGYYLRAVTNNPNEDARDVNNVLGVKVDGSMEIASTVNYFFEYAKQTGSNTTVGADRDASALRIGGGYKTELASLGVVSVEGSYISMSGNKLKADGSLEDPKKAGTYTGILSNYNYFSAMLVEPAIVLRSNGLKALNLNASISPDAIEGVTLGFGCTIFSSAEYIRITSSTIAKGHLGNEIDLTCTYKYNDKTNIDLTYARFSPDIVQTANNDSASMLKFQLVTKF